MILLQMKRTKWLAKKSDGQQCQAQFPFLK